MKNNRHEKIDATPIPRSAMPKLTVFSTQSPPAVIDYPRPDRLVSGNPKRSTQEFFTAPAGDLSAGIWHCAPGAWRIAFAEGKDEFFCVISGRLRISAEDGEAHEFSAGEAAVIPGGFTGTFEVIEAVSKYFVVLERAAGIAL